MDPIAVSAAIAALFSVGVSVYSSLTAARRGRVENILDIIDELRKELDRYKEKHDVLQKDYELLGKEHYELREEYSKERAAFSLKEAEYEKVIANLRSNIQKDFAEQFAIILAENEELQQKLAKQEGVTMRLQKRIKELENKQTGKLG